MSNNLQVKPEKLLGVIGQALDKAFFGAEKPRAKKLFREISEGGQPGVFSINAGPAGDINCRLALDASVCKSRVSFALFRQVLAAHLHQVANRLKSGQDANVYTAENSQEVLFNLPGAIEYHGQVYILVTGVEPTGPGELVIRLQFLDPEQFRRPVDEGAGDGG